MSARPHALDLPGRRLVVVDVETNGLHGDVRILSLGLAELRRGIVARSQHWLIDPGNVRMEEGAIAVNGLTPELLEGASSFADNFETIAEWLQPGPTRLTLVAHNAHFDAARLRDEFRRLGEELPSFDLLDTRRLAEATEIPVTSRSLAALLDALGLANTAPHTALADTLAVANLVDGCILVVRAGDTERQFVAGSLRQLHSARAQILGIVLNNVSEELGSYYRYYSHYYKYNSQNKDESAQSEI